MVHSTSFSLAIVDIQIKGCNLQLYEVMEEAPLSPSQEGKTNIKTRLVKEKWAKLNSNCLDKFRNHHKSEAPINSLASLSIFVARQ